MYLRRKLGIGGTQARRLVVLRSSRCERRHGLEKLPLQRAHGLQRAHERRLVARGEPLGLAHGGEKLRMGGLQLRVKAPLKLQQLLVSRGKRE